MTDLACDDWSRGPQGILKSVNHWTLVVGTCPDMQRSKAASLHQD
jgi:hypothetical protein